MKCKEIVVHTTKGFKKYQNVSAIHATDRRLSFIAGSDFLSFDMRIVDFYECFGYELEIKH